MPQVHFLRPPCVHPLLPNVLVHYNSHFIFYTAAPRTRRLQGPSTASATAGFLLIKGNTTEPIGITPPPPPRPSPYACVTGACVSPVSVAHGPALAHKPGPTPPQANQPPLAVRQWSPPQLPCFASDANGPTEDSHQRPVLVESGHRRHSAADRMVAAIPWRCPPE